jgi:ATP-binding cassette, subfamily B (MDR/TAP), member 1
VEGTDLTAWRACLPAALTIPCPMAPSALDPLLQVINREPQIADASGAEPLQQLRGAIELSDVHFSYPARPDVQIFSGMNLSIAVGQTVALVGESGSGESVVS